MSVVREVWGWNESKVAFYRDLCINSTEIIHDFRLEFNKNISVFQKLRIFPGRH